MMMDDWEWWRKNRKLVKFRGKIVPVTLLSPRWRNVLPIIFTLNVLFSSSNVRILLKDITNRQVTNCALRKVCKKNTEKSCVVFLSYSRWSVIREWPIHTSQTASCSTAQPRTPGIGWTTAIYTPPILHTTLHKCICTILCLHLTVSSA